MLAALPYSVFNARDFVAVFGIPKDIAAALVVQMDLSLAAASETLEILAAGGKSERASAALAVWRKTAEEFRHFVRCNPTLEDLFE